MQSTQVGSDAAKWLLRRGSKWVQQRRVLVATAAVKVWVGAGWCGRRRHREDRAANQNESRVEVKWVRNLTTGCARESWEMETSSYQCKRVVQMDVFLQFQAWFSLTSQHESSVFVTELQMNFMRTLSEKNSRVQLRRFQLCVQVELLLVEQQGLSLDLQTTCLLNRHRCM